MNSLQESRDRNRQIAFSDDEIQDLTEVYTLYPSTYLVGHPLVNMSVHIDLFGSHIKINTYVNFIGYEFALGSYDILRSGLPEVEFPTLQSNNLYAIMISMFERILIHDRRILDLFYASSTPEDNDDEYYSRDEYPLFTQNGYFDADAVRAFIRENTEMIPIADLFPRDLHLELDPNNFNSIGYLRRITLKSGTIIYLGIIGERFLKVIVQVFELRENYRENYIHVEESGVVYSEAWVHQLDGILDALPSPMPLSFTFDRINKKIIPAEVETEDTMSVIFLPEYIERADRGENEFDQPITRETLNFLLQLQVGDGLRLSVDPDLRRRITLEIVRRLRGYDSKPLEEMPPQPRLEEKEFRRQWKKNVSRRYRH